MKNIEKSRGFTVVEIVLVIVVIGLLGYISYTAWRAMDKKADSQTSQTDTDKKDEKQAATDPYMGWKEYCSSAGGYCLKYPSDWTLSEEETPDPAIKAARFTPSDDEFTVQYNPFLSGIGGAVEPGTAFFTTFSLTKLSGVNGLNIAQGVYINKSVSTQYSPMWFIVRDADVDTYGLKEGETSDVGFFVPRLADTQTFGIRTNKLFTSTAEAKEWFKGKNLETTKLIFESFSVKN